MSENKKAPVTFFDFARCYPRAFVLGVVFVLAGCGLVALAISEAGRQSGIARQEEDNRRTEEILRSRNRAATPVAPTNSDSRQAAPVTAEASPTRSPSPDHRPSNDCDGTAAYKADGTYGKLCLEEEIIYADNDGRLRGREVDINRARYLINYLQQRTSSPRSEIADRAFRTSQMFKNNKGLNISSLRVLEEAKGVVDAIPSDKKEEIGKIYALVYTLIK